MAELVVIEGQEFKKRNPWGVWGLAIVTLGIYGLVWYYKINDEARRYLRDETIKPGLSVLALFPGGLVVIPPYVSIYRTGERIQRMRRHTELPEQQPIGLFGLLLAFVLSLFVPYFQNELNKVWDAAVGVAIRGSAAPGIGGGPPAIPATPPAPPAIPPAPPEAPAPPPPPSTEA